MHGLPFRRMMDPSSSFSQRGALHVVHPMNGGENLKARLLAGPHLYILHPSLFISLMIFHAGPWPKDHDDQVGDGNCVRSRPGNDPIPRERPLFCFLLLFIFPSLFSNPPPIFFLHRLVSIKRVRKREQKRSGLFGGLHRFD